MRALALLISYVLHPLWTPCSFVGVAVDVGPLASLAAGRHDLRGDRFAHQCLSTGRVHLHASPQRRSFRPRGFGAKREEMAFFDCSVLPSAGLFRPHPSWGLFATGSIGFGGGDDGSSGGGHFS